MFYILPIYDHWLRILCSLAVLAMLFRLTCNANSAGWIIWICCLALLSILAGCLVGYAGYNGRHIMLRILAWGLFLPCCVRWLSPYAGHVGWLAKLAMLSMMSNLVGWFPKLAMQAGCLCWMPGYYGRISMPSGCVWWLGWNAGLCYWLAAYADLLAGIASGGHSMLGGRLCMLAGYALWQAMITAWLFWLSASLSSLCELASNIVYA